MRLDMLLGMYDAHSHRRQILILLSRQAQELGLHRQKEIYQTDQTNLENTLSLFWYEENKKRLWINLFVWDR